MLKGYNDANWIYDSDKIKFTSSYIFTLGGGVVWKSFKQTLIATSTMESEFIGIEFAGKEAEWLRNLIPIRNSFGNAADTFGLYAL